MSDSRGNHIIMYPVDSLIAMIIGLLACSKTPMFAGMTPQSIEPISSLSIHPGQERLADVMEMLGLAKEISLNSWGM